MESAATPATPKRSRAKPKSKVKAEVALSYRERMAAVDARAAEVRQQVLEKAIADGYGPMPRTSFRWMGRRTKGLPYSRMIFVSAKPGLPGMRGSIEVRHPTRKTWNKTLTATDAILETFMPSLPGSLTAAMLGAN